MPAQATIHFFPCLGCFNTVRCEEQATCKDLDPLVFVVNPADARAYGSELPAGTCVMEKLGGKLVPIQQWLKENP